MTSEEKIKDLEQKLKEAQAVIMFYTKSGETREVRGRIIEYDVGRYDCEEEAGRARYKKAKELFGEDVNLNFPEEVQDKVK